MLIINVTWYSILNDLSNFNIGVFFLKQFDRNRDGLRY